MKKGVDFTGVSIVFHCHDGKGNFVMGKRSQNARDERGKWDQGGGALEFGEKIENALKREIKEEYGAKVLDYEFIGLMDVHRKDHNGNKTHWIALCHKVLVERESVRNASPKDHDEIGWFTLDKLPDPLHSQMPVFLKKYKGKLSA